jgi:hypothetical protein
MRRISGGQNLPKNSFQNSAKPLIFHRRFDLAGIQSFWPGPYVLFLRVNAEPQIMPSSFILLNIYRASIAITLSLASPSHSRRSWPAILLALVLLATSTFSACSRASSNTLAVENAFNERLSKTVFTDRQLSNCAV